MLTRNPNATRRPYPADLKQILSMAEAQQSRQWLAHWPLLSPDPTPLWDMPGLAHSMNIGALAIKDESRRSALGSFKTLGAPVALMRLITRLRPTLEPATLIRGGYRQLLDNFTVISATDGNHGRALAAAAQSVGCRAVIVLHARVSLEREQAIAAFGAQIVRIAGNYDESVTEAARLAREQGWQVVSDTSYPGYEEIARDVMQGYGTICAEIDEQTDRLPASFSHVLLQSGVGGLAAGVASYWWESFGAQRPCFIVVEPHQADCLYQSALAGRPERARGSVDSLMAGLACGETSPLAWRILQPCIDHFLTIGDQDAVAAMRILATGSGSDLPVLAGESGAAGLAGLQALTRDAALAEAVGLNHTSRVLVINTEGATAPTLYRECVGEPAENVLRRQAEFLSALG